ncbi:unnamed protein product [Heterobilharzia americana]|nr:unnamed protein product [Heterobilharzia americana]
MTDVDQENPMEQDYLTMLMNKHYQFTITGPVCPAISKLLRELILSKNDEFVTSYYTAAVRSKLPLLSHLSMYIGIDLHGICKKNTFYSLTFG